MISRSLRRSGTWPAARLIHLLICHEYERRLTMSFFSRFFGKGKTPPSDDGPFMEYPSDDYESSLKAMTSAFARLKTGDYGDRWITFSAQGTGHDQDSYQI